MPAELFADAAGLHVLNAHAYRFVPSSLRPFIDPWQACRHVVPPGIATRSRGSIRNAPLPRARRRSVGSVRRRHSRLRRQMGQRATVSGSLKRLAMLPDLFLQAHRRLTGDLLNHIIGAGEHASRVDVRHFNAMLRRRRAPSLFTMCSWYASGRYPFVRDFLPEHL